MSVHPANLLRTTLAKFLLAPPLGGFGRMVGANVKRLFQLFSVAGSAMILRRVSQNAVAHCARAALGILLINVFDCGCSICDPDES